MLIERDRINSTLRRFGMGTLDEGAALMAQIGFLIEGHDQYRQLLITCEPYKRSLMYDSLRPYLRFEPKPLDVYISEGGMQAEREQLPTLDESGRFQAFRVQEILSPETVLVRNAVAESVAQHHLHLVCKKCTREAVFSGIRKADAVEAARNAGWTYSEIDGNGREICPKCPA